MSKSPQPMARRPTIKDVAAAAGVSIKTVSRVVNNVSTVDESIANDVRESIRTLGYRPNQLASTLKAGSATATVGLVLKDISNEFYSSITLGVSSVVRLNESQLFTAASAEDISNDEEIDLIFELCRRRVDGVIIVPRGGDYSRLQAEIDLGVPMVFLDREGTGVEADSVLLDNFTGTREAIEALVAAGHRRIGFVFHSLDLPQIRQRFEGAMSALRDAGIAIDTAPIASDVQDAQSARAVTEEFLALEEPPTAIFAVNNRLTEGVIDAVWHTRAQVVVSGFDDFRFSHLMPVPLLLVAYDTREYGRAAARLLFDRINGDDSPRKSVVVPTGLVRRGIEALRGRIDTD